eukprot:gene20951-biopygen5626
MALKALLPPCLYRLPQESFCRCRQTRRSSNPKWWLRSFVSKAYWPQNSGQSLSLAIPQPPWAVCENCQLLHDFPTGLSVYSVSQS